MKYKINGEDMSAVANAIRTKGSTSAPLEFPSGFVNAINDIPSEALVLVSKTITTNGTYDPEDDNADAYSEVTVNVQYPNYISGTFTGSNEEKGSAKSITVPYSGSGYPIACMVYPSAGGYNSSSTYYQTIHKNAECMFMFAKSDTGTAPNWSSHSDAANNVTTLALYKGSDSDATVMSRGGGNTMISLGDRNAAATASDCVRFKSSTELSVYIASTSYGFMAGVEYTYHIIYSS